MSKVGKLRSTGQLQINTPSQLGAGKKDSYSTLLTCRGEFYKQRGSRIFDSSETIIASTWIWECRYQNAINNITNKKSIRWIIDGRTFTVSNYEKIEQKNRYFKFTLLENE